MNTSRSLTLFLAMALLGLLFLALSASPARAADPLIVRVTTSGTTVWPCGDQSDWSNACALQTALTNASSGTELWVASGTYKPTTDNNRAATFQLIEGVALYGGFAGTETQRSQRNLYANGATLSGDIGTPGDSSDNSYHVTTARTLTAATVLDGFTIWAGNANGSSYPDDRGAGMFGDVANPTLRNVTFIENSASFAGGGIYNNNCSPTLTDVSFLNNTGSNFGGGMHSAGGHPTLTSVVFMGNTADSGGGMYNAYSTPTLIDARFFSNSGVWGGGLNNNHSNSEVRDADFERNTASFGGGMYNHNSSPLLMNITFKGNSATETGGGLFNTQSNPLLTNITFVGNSATGAISLGGGIGNYQSASGLHNVTFYNNSAKNGGGIGNALTSTLLIFNTILWGNTASNGPQIYNETSTPNMADIHDSVVQGGYAGGMHIVTDDPRLGPVGYWGGTLSGGTMAVLPLLPGSSAIDAADDLTCTTTDQRGVARPVGSHCDIGAFEGVLDQAHLPLIGK